MIDCLGLITGGKSQREMIRSGEDRAMVSAVFSVCRDIPALTEAGIEPVVSESRNSSVGELIQLQNFFVSLRDGSKSRFVSAAGDETRQGEAEMAAPLKAKP